MDVYFNLTTGRLQTLQGTPVDFNAVRKSALPVALRFIGADGIVVALPDPDSNAVITLGVKSDSADYSAGYLASVSTWVKTGTGITTVYTGLLSLNTDQVDAVFTSTSQRAAPVRVEMDYRYGSGVPIKSLPVTGSIFNAIITGDEPATTSGDPTFPVSFAPTITGLTGGGATNLDGQTGGTAGIPVGKPFLLNVTGLGAQLWYLVAGTDAADGTTIIHPTNYDAGTFAFVFKRIL